jgi:type I restriction enzyme R subunit
MSQQPRSERETQNRVIALFTASPDHLGYDYLRDWRKEKKTRALNQAIMQELLTGRKRLI